MKNKRFSYRSGDRPAKAWPSAHVRHNGTPSLERAAGRFRIGSPLPDTAKDPNESTTTRKAGSLYFQFQAGKTEAQWGCDVELSAAPGFGKNKRGIGFNQILI
jgi:hypothetical protein